MLIKIESGPKIFQGYLYGLQQQSLLISLIIDASNFSNFENISSIIQKYLFNNNFTEPPNQDQISVVTFFAKVIIGIQNLNRIPCSDKYYFEVDEFSIEKNKFILLLPFQKLDALKISIDFCLNIFNKYSQISRNEIDQLKLSKEFKEINDRLHVLADLSQNNFYLQKGALELNIPILKNRTNLLKLGIGTSSLLLNSSITSNTSAIGLDLSKDKHRTSEILRSMGMPTPINFKISNINEALYFAKKLEYPVVIKPADREQGKGVFADIIDDATLNFAFNQALKFSKNIIIEKHYEGIGHRLTILHGKIIKVTKKLPMGVLGDGRSNIYELILEASRNRMQDHKQGDTKPFSILLDEEAKRYLLQKKLTEESIVELNQFVPLKRKNNTSSGGSTELIPIEDVHPDNIDLAVRVAKLFNLDILGIDLIIPNIQDSWLETKAVICDVNGQPQTDNETIKKILLDIFPNEGRIPIHLIIAGDEKIDFYQKNIDTFTKELNCNTFSTREGIYINNKRVTKEFSSFFAAAEALMLYPDILQGLSLIPSKEVLQYGLPFDHFDSITLDDQTLSEQELIFLLKSTKPHAKVFKQSIH